MCCNSTYDIITKAHIATGHCGRDRMLKHLRQKYANITTDAVELFKSYCVVCQEKRKRPKTTGVVVKPILSSEFNDPKAGLTSSSLPPEILKAGILSKKYSRNQFDLCLQQLLNDSDVHTESTITLRQALKSTDCGTWTRVLPV